MKVGIVGLGAMGHAFAERLLAQAFSVQVYNRSTHKSQDLVAGGALVHPTIESLIDTVDIIVLMLSDAQAIEQQLSFNERLQGKTVVQMATISPAESLNLGEQVEDCDANYLEAPVLGSIPEAQSGRLIIMAGGRQRVFDRVLPVLACLGATPRLIGEVGSAAALKLAMNQLIASLTSGFALSLGYALNNQVDINVFMDTVRESALYAKTYDKKLAKYLGRDFTAANFSTRHLLKDIRLFNEHAAELGLETSALQGIEQITRKAVESGLADRDYSSIYQVIDPPPKDES